MISTIDFLISWVEAVPPLLTKACSVDHMRSMSLGTLWLFISPHPLLGVARITSRNSLLSITAYSEFQSSSISSDLSQPSSAGTSESTKTGHLTARSY